MSGGGPELGAAAAFGEIRAGGDVGPTHSKVRLAFGALFVLSALVVPFAVSDRAQTHGGKIAAEELRYAPGSEEFGSVEDYWSARVTYPTGILDQRWLLSAAKQDKLVKSAVPSGPKSYRAGAESPLTLNPNAFTSLGPAPEQISGYGHVSGRVNSIAIDPLQTNVAYFAAVGGGVWKSTNCCTTGTTWSPVTDAPHINGISINDVYIDPTDHSTVYAATGDLNFGSFAMGTIGVLRSKDQGSTWEVLGADVFTPVYPPNLTPTYPQYQAIGKVRVDPNNGNTIVAGTKTGLYFSWDHGTTWSGPCATNQFADGQPDDQRQDITGLITRDDGSSTTLFAAVGTRGYPTTVQPNLGKNGANGIYSMTIPASPPAGCPAVASWTLLTTAANGWSGFAPTTAGVPCDPPVGSTSACPAGSNRLGRIDLAMAPSNPNVFYAEVQAIDAGCGRGCFLGLWRTANGGTTWTKQAAPFTGACGSGSSDSAQNWYNQGLAVSPTDPNVVFIDMIDIWRSPNGGTTMTDVTCGYGSGTTHVDQHALTFVPGSGTTMLAGNDGGIYLTTNAHQAATTFTQLNDSVSTIEFYSGDISANFANDTDPFIVGGAQDNGSSAFQWTTGNPGPAIWTERNGGDGMFARIEQKLSESNPGQTRIYMESQWGNMVRSLTGIGGPYAPAAGNWGAGNAASGDRESFVMPYELDRHHCPGAICDHIIAGTYRVWESILGGTSLGDWYVNSPDLTKCNPPVNPCTSGLRDRAIINALFYGHSDNSVAVVGTNDGNVQYGFGLGLGVQNTGTWVNVTGNNAVLPNRPILDVTTSANNPLVSYVAIGGFDENTSTTPGHVYEVTCTALCASFTWADKSGDPDGPGRLPNIPADSIAVNPNVPKQVFVGTDWGLYFTNNISAVSPVWNRFDAGLPHVMIWDMAVDRGATTLAVFTRGRGAYAWPLPKTPTAVRVSSFSANAARRAVTLSWRTAAEIDTLGFNVWRDTNGKGVKVNRSLVAAKRQTRGATYRLVDRQARPGVSYAYRLQAVSTTGARAWHGRTTVRAQR